jgi:hypothetical protein
MEKIFIHSTTLTGIKHAALTKLSKRYLCQTKQQFAILIKVVREAITYIPAQQIGIITRFPGRA